MLDLFAQHHLRASVPEWNKGSLLAWPGKFEVIQDA